MLPLKHRPSQTKHLKRIRGQRAHAFTLIEMALAMTVSTILFIMLYNIFSNTSLSLSKATQSADYRREARATLSFMAKELKASFTEDDNADTNANEEVRFRIIDGKDCDADADLRFYGTFSSEFQEQGKDAGDLCFVRYYIPSSLEDDHSDLKSKKLYRYFESSADAFKRGFQPSDMTSVNDNEGSPLSFNVICFDIVVYKWNDNRELEILEPVADSSELEKCDPASIELRLSIVSSEDAAQLSETDWDTLGLDDPRVETFTTRVTLKQRPSK